MWKNLIATVFIIGGIGVFIEGFGNGIAWSEPVDHSVRFDECGPKWKAAKEDYARKLEKVGKGTVWPEWATVPLLIGGVGLFACGCVMVNSK